MGVVFPARDGQHLPASSAPTSKRCYEHGENVGRLIMIQEGRGGGGGGGEG